MGFASGIIFLPFIVLTLAFVFGSVLAYRGEKSWRTRLMLIGSGCQILGFVSYVVVALLMNFVRRGGSIYSSYATYSIVMAIAGLAILVGMVVFAIAFVAYCARAGAARKRADELEEMLGHLQQRIAEQDRL